MEADRWANIEREVLEIKDNKGFSSNLSTFILLTLVFTLSVPFYIKELFNNPYWPFGLVFILMVLFCIIMSIKLAKQALAESQEAKLIKVKDIDSWIYVEKDIADNISVGDIVTIEQSWTKLNKKYLSTYKIIN